MDLEMFLLSLLAGLSCGEKNTCGDEKKRKIKHIDEAAAIKHASQLNKFERKTYDVGPYPCSFCWFWHVGRLMTIEELNDRAERVKRGQSLATKVAQGGVHVQDGQDAPRMGAGEGSAQSAVPQDSECGVRLVLEEDVPSTCVLVLQPEEVLGGRAAQQEEQGQEGLPGTGEGGMA